MPLLDKSFMKTTENVYTPKKRNLNLVDVIHSVTFLYTSPVGTLYYTQYQEIITNVTLHRGLDGMPTLPSLFPLRLQQLNKHHTTSRSCKITMGIVYVYSTKTHNVPLADNLAVAIYSYEPNHDGDLGFEKGDKLKIINK